MPSDTDMIEQVLVLRGCCKPPTKTGEKKSTSPTKKGEKVKEGGTRRQLKLRCAKNRLIIVNSESSTLSMESNKGPTSKGMSKGHGKITAKLGDWHLLG